MPVDYYPNVSVDELKDLLKGLQSQQAKGAITEVYAAGVRTVRDVKNSNGADVEILRVLYSLHLRDPDNWANPYAQRITRARPRYSSPPVPQGFPVA